MSRPTTPQFSTENGRQHRGRSRGPQRAFRSRGQYSQHSTRQRQNVPQSSQSNQVFDWFHEEFRTVEPDEYQDSRPTSGFAPSFPGPSRGQRRGNNHNRQRKNSGGSTQSNHDDRSCSKYSKFSQLMRLSQMSGNDIVTEISDNTDFTLWLNSEMKKDLLVLTLRTLAKLEEAHFTRIVIDILNNVCESKFLENLEHYLVALPTETRDDMKVNRFYWKGINKFWNDLYNFFKRIVNLIPTQTHDKLLPILQLTMQYIIASLRTKQDHKIHEDVELRMQELYHELKQKTKNSVRLPGNEMLQDFRNLSIVPTVEDLNDYHPFIRPCKVHGAYDSVDHYLDVQFRLLREDFICPLRTGIQEYKRSIKINVEPSQISDIRVFPKVKLIGSTVVKNKVGVTIFFGVRPKMNWIRSKLFMYGSLLCLTRDNFKSVLFATVAERDPQLLVKGELIIEPCVGTIITLEMYKFEYVMVESKVYFLPYYHTLSSLRYMTEEHFPMKRYVVDAQSRPTPPKYLDKSKVYVYKGFNIPVMDERRWPSPRHLKLDESQYEAFKSALLQELSVLHGPPGTGKTFMALQIASTLLANSSSWYNPVHPTPMIVVCLTNHALDQFLEGILSYTKSLVRIGEQSKNPSLAQFKLKAVRDNYFKDEKNKHRAWQRMCYYQRQLKKLLYSLTDAYATLRALISNTSIVSPNILRQYCNDQELQDLTTKDLLTKLFGAARASCVFEIKPIPSNSSQSVANDESDSEDENIDADDDLDVASVTYVNNTEVTCLEMSHLETLIQKCETEMIINQNDDNNPHTNSCRFELNTRLRQLHSLRTALQEKMNHHPLVNSLAPQGYCRDKDWGVYCHWLTSSYEVVKEKIAELEKEYQETSSQLNDFKQLTDLEVMRNSLVVGLTTTGAARLHESLHALRSPIVIVEEAAEILEAHVICSLTEHCQQVILIGDHKQLRPKPATYNLEINYNMNISLFERIVKMRDKCTQLVIQHRMRPEIAELISPSIYERLENHTSVFTYPAVKGVEKNLFFLHHENRESGSSENESMSNLFEVKFLLSFAKYLRQQGYAPDEITILCTYSGQLFKFKEVKKAIPILRDVRVTTVDNYQGEENRIILLSLVRNNHTGRIGFLRTENRVCVALSRAREGLYIMGNMNNLVVNNEIWPKIKNTLTDNNSIGDSLVLQCQIHTNQLTKVKLPTDFKNPDGGCSRRCDAALACGHTCLKRCHISDRDHNNYICKAPCLKKCPRGHPCQLLCKAACERCQTIVTFKFECGHSRDLPCSTNMQAYKCTAMVTTLLRCRHTVEKPCFQDSSTFPCTHDCKKTLPCGHFCIRKCHINDDPSHLTYTCQENCKKMALGCPNSHPCPKKCHELCETCTVKMKKERSCGHVHNIACSKDVEKIICTRRCKRDLPCGHVCKQKCYLPCGKCEEMVDKIVPDCGHEVKLQCCEEPRTAVCKGQCPRKLNCGHPCTAQCCDPCTKRCEYPRPLPKPALCQHFYPVPCYKIVNRLAEYADNLLQHCPKPCATLLPCGHTCNGSCGSCKQGRIHQPCREQCSKILICGHKCEALCKDICRPCRKICSLKCEHTECQKKCGEPCTPCREPCSWQCQHLKCKKLCFEICDRECCDEPCPKYLKCGHPCIGFCGEPCPSLCRICDEKDLPTFISDANKPAVRFVFLPDCGHCIESNYLDWVWQRSYRIGIKVCPLCNTRISQCKRYTNQIKKECKNIEIVEKQILVRIQNLRADQQIVLNDISLIKQQYAKEFPGLNAYKQLFKSLQTLVDQRKTLSLGILKDISTKLKITGLILKKVQEIPPIYRDVNDWSVVLNQITMLITSLPLNQNISHQMMDDITNELGRLHYMIQLCKFESKHALNLKKNALQVEIIYLGLLNLRKFTNAKKIAIHEQLVELKKSLKSSIPIDKLNQITVKIMGLDQEDWCKCPSGHIYFIECEECQLAPSAPIGEA